MKAILSDLGAGWPRSRVEVPRHDPGPWPAKRALSGHRHHAQERKAAQVLGPGCLLGPSDRGGLCQPRSGSGEVRTGQESHGQRCSAGSKISLWLGSIPVSFGGGSFRSGGPSDIMDSSDEMDAQEDGAGEEDPVDIWLLLASYIHPEDTVNFSLICKNAWTVTCTAAFWTSCTEGTTHWVLLYLCGCDQSPRRSCAVSGHGDPISVPYLRTVCCSNLQESCHSGKRSQHTEEFQMLTFLVQKDCWERTRTSVGVQLQVQKTVSWMKERVYGMVATTHSVLRCSYQP